MDNAAFCGALIWLDYNNHVSYDENGAIMTISDKDIAVRIGGEMEQ